MPHPAGVQPEKALSAYAMLQGLGKKLPRLAEFLVWGVFCDPSEFTSEALRLMTGAILPLGSFGFFEEWAGLVRLAMAQG